MNISQVGIKYNIILKYINKVIFYIIVSTNIFKHETERHHIIAKIHPRAKEARDIFVKKCRRNINDEKNIANVRTKYHKVMHTKVYFEEVYNLIGSAYSSGGSVMVINVLGMLKDVLEEL